MTYEERAKSVEMAKPREFKFSQISKEDLASPREGFTFRSSNLAVQ